MNRADFASKPWEHAKSAGSAADPLAARFVESLSLDARLYDADIRGSLAHAAMLRQQGLIGGGDLDAIQRGLAEIREEIESAPAGPTAVGAPGAWPGWRIELEDAHMCIEAALIAKIGEPGRRLHTGRSRNDQVALDLRLWLVHAAAVLAASLDSLLSAFESLAQRQGDAVMPGYTHLQRAQPICIGGELMAWHAMLARDRREALRLAADSFRDESPLGSGALAGSTLPLDPAATAASLGFARPPTSAIDSTASRDEALDFLYLLARTSMHLSRLAEQWIVYCSTEFSFLVLDERHTTGSSMMPQKRNPDLLELIRARCGAVYGHLVAMLTVLKGLPVGYNRDLQEDKRHVFGAFDLTVDCIDMAARVVAAARFRADHIASTLDRGYLEATALAERLVTLGVAFRTAHQVVGSLVRRCEHAVLGSLARLSGADVEAALRSYGVSSVRFSDDELRSLTPALAADLYASAGNAGRSGYRHALRLALDQRRDPASAATSPLSPDSPRPAAAPRDPAPLFSVAPDDADARLADAYRRVGRTLDDLPYTPEFDRLYAAVEAQAHGFSRHDLLHRLHTMRKAGRLPRLGRSSVSPPVVIPAEEALIERLVAHAAGSLGQRDQLPYSPAFDSLVEQFNAAAGRALSPHDVWRLVAKIAK